MHPFITTHLRGFPVDSVLRDLQYAVRQLRRGGVTTFIAALTIAVGVAVTTVMLSVVDVVLLRPLPYPHSDRLMSVELTTVQERGTSPHGSIVPYDLYQRWMQGAASVEEFAAQSNDYATVEIRGKARDQNLRVVTPNLFTFLGAKPMLGRAFTREEGAPGSAPAVILSHEFWLHAFGGDSAAVGRQLLLSGRRYAIVGIMPKGFNIPNTESNEELVFLPIGATLGPGVTEAVNVLARLNVGATALQLQNELDHITAGAPETLLSIAGRREQPRSAVQVAPLRNQLIAEVERPVKMLLGAVLCVIVIICANVAGLQLTRISSRRQEFALRVTIGASRARIARLVVAESMILAVAGGAAGIMLSVAAFPSVIALFGSELPEYSAIGLDKRVLIVTVLAIIAMGALFGAASAAIASRGGQRLGMSDGLAGAGTSKTRVSAGNAIVISELALTMVMLGFTGLLTRSYVQLTQSERGYDARGVVKASVTMNNPSTATTQAQAEFSSSILARVRDIPGVTHAAVAIGAPLSGTYRATVLLADPSGTTKSYKAQAVWSTPEYFEAMGMRLVQGRFPEPSDAGQTLAIDAAAAKAFFDNGNALGQQLRMKSDSITRTVVGVVGSISEIYKSPQNVRIRANEPHVFVPYSASSRFTLLVRTSGGVAATSTRIERAVHEENALAIASTPTELQATIYQLYSRETVLTELAVAFAVLGLLIASGGLYAIISYGAAQRTREFGIRMALGAQAHEIATLTVRRGLWLAVSGCTIGLAITAAMSGYARALLFEIAPLDPVALGVAGALLLCVSLGASYVPARRATTIEVTTALRNE